jgi:hypothetical protein
MLWWVLAVSVGAQTSGSIDSSFNPELPARFKVSQISEDSKGRLLIAGVDGDEHTVIRLLADGRRDKRFAAPRIQESNLIANYPYISAVRELAGGKILVTGFFREEGLRRTNAMYLRRNGGLNKLRKFLPIGAPSAIRSDGSVAFVSRVETSQGPSLLLARPNGTYTTLFNVGPYARFAQIHLSGMWVQSDDTVFGQVYDVPGAGPVYRHFQSKDNSATISQLSDGGYFTGFSGNAVQHYVATEFGVWRVKGREWDTNFVFTMASAITNRGERFAVAEALDGKVVFAHLIFGSEPRLEVGRVNTDGSPDESFQILILARATARIPALLRDRWGRILLLAAYSFEGDVFGQETLLVRIHP